MNPFQAPTIDRGSVPRRQLWFVSAVIVVAWIAIIVSSRSLGAHGFGLALYAIAGSWFLITRSTSNLLWPLNRIKPTIVECLVVLAICGVLHGLAIPAVTTNCVGRRQPNATLSTNVVGPQSADERAKHYEY